MLLQIPGILVKNQEIHHIRYVMLTPGEQKSFPPDSVAVYVLLWHKLSQGNEVYHASEFGISDDRDLDVSFAQSFAGLNLWTEHAARRFHAPGLRWLPALGFLVSGCLALRIGRLYARGRRSVSTLLGGPSDPDVTISENEVQLATLHLDARFSQKRPLNGTYMLFGGGQLDHPDAVSSISLAGLHADDVRRIAARYPDFYMCKSPGASLAKKAVVDLDLIPADGRTQKALWATLDRFNENIQSGGDRVCVSIRGQELDLESVEIREAKEPITEHYRNNNFFLVTSASMVDCQQATGAR
jgi:hypothetical protein